MISETELNDYELDNLAPGDHNPLDQDAPYNPLNHTYEVKCDTEGGEVVAHVQLLLQDWSTQAPITFQHEGQTHQVRLFPVLPECTLPPDQDGTFIEKWTTYQIGEAKYHIVPAVVKATKNGENLSRTAAQYLLTPEVLNRGLYQYYLTASDDPNAPAALLAFLEAWNSASSTGDDEEEEDDNETPVFPRAHHQSDSDDDYDEDEEDYDEDEEDYDEDEEDYDEDEEDYDDEDDDYDIEDDDWEEEDEEDD